MSKMEEEAKFWNNAYHEAYGVWPSPLISQGTELKHVQYIQSAVARYWVEKLKERYNGQA